jgi:BirA family biotin operon repressor/biotin-[acetyl-CoA-carboxylase] ligase
MTPSLLAALGHAAPRLTAEIHGTLDSTNTLARTRAKEDVPALYIARAQTGGRGRLGRSFHSPADTGLYMTVAYTTDRPLTEAVRVTAAAAVAACAAIEALTDRRPAIKWVNDLYLGGCKIGGILTEAVSRGDGTHRMIVGWGINLTTASFPEGLRAPASCLFAQGDAPEELTVFADTLAGEIARRLLELAEVIPHCPLPSGMWGETCLDFYRRRLLWVGEDVVCTRGSESFAGTLLGVDGDYSLLVEADGRTLTLSSGEISVRSIRRPGEKF